MGGGGGTEHWAGTLREERRARPGWRAPGVESLREPCSARCGLAPLE